MSELVRVSISLEQALLEKLEALVEQSGYGNRSEFLRDLIRARLVEEAWEQDQEAIGTISLVYDHHARQLGEKLTDLQHDHHEQVLATTHVHLSHDLCAEVIIVKGRASEIRGLADSIRKQKGVLHAELSMGSTGHDLA